MNQGFPDITLPALGDILGQNLPSFVALQFHGVVLWQVSVGSRHCGEPRLRSRSFPQQLTGDPDRKDGGVWGFAQNVQNNPDGWDNRREAARPWEKTVSPTRSLAPLLQRWWISDATSSLSHAHSLSRFSRRGGQLRSCPLGGSFHRSRAFTFQPAAGSFAVDSTDVIYFIRPLWKWLPPRQSNIWKRAASKARTCSQRLLCDDYFWIVSISKLPFEWHSRFSSFLV